MPSQKKRINLTVDDEINSLLDDLAELTGRPKATIIMDMLKEAVPTLKTVRKGLIMAKNSRDKLPIVFAEFASDINSRTATINNDLAVLMQTDWVDDND